ncbi:unnamed protein product [Calicophoron daubneyi]|uniref:Uncharacterized protein n=1 Tax=Calicophoron daubneyi TaxID=300641 RepID=A0AAV2TEB8_CALDB
MARKITRGISLLLLICMACSSRAAFRPLRSQAINSTPRRVVYSKYYPEEELNLESYPERELDYNRRDLYRAVKRFYPEVEDELSQSNPSVESLLRGIDGYDKKRNYGFLRG